MKPHYDDDETSVYIGDCLDVLRALPDESVDAVVTDPPYGLSNTDPGHIVEALGKWLGGDRTFLPSTGGGFMGKAWDSFVPPPAVWDEALRVLKPGGHLLAFAGSRTQDLMGLSIRLAGFDVRDNIAWLYGSGFPKSMDVSKAIDKAAGAERLKVRKTGAASAYSANAGNDRPWMQKARDEGFIEVDGDTPATDAAREWEGWGTALKPAHEPIIVARKPFPSTVAANVLAHGTGALNIDATRISTTDDLNGGGYSGERREASGATSYSISRGGIGEYVQPSGRWPANVMLDESQAAALDAQTGTLTSGANPKRRGADKSRQVLGEFAGQDDANPQRGTDSGGASRFFYVAKAPTSERPKDADGNGHSTVKPLALMRQLVRLVTPPGGVVLEPFAGSGTTIEAAILEGFAVIGIEREVDYWPLIRQRIARGNGVEG
jgi:DNA modification methylase